MSLSDKHAAAQYILGPLNDPTPNEETGLGASFRVQPSTVIAHNWTGDSASTNPFRRNTGNKKDGAKTHIRSVSNPSSHSIAAYRKDAFGSIENDSRRRSTGQTQPSESSSNGRHRRSSSLKERFPGDPSVRPLDIIRRETKTANRSSHLQRRHRPGADSIDRLDATYGGVKYHHEGPYDAALLARNSSWSSSPIAALDLTNKEALKATPIENVKDSLERHRPLDGVASIPPGQRDRFGRLYEYEEGSNMMIVNGGDYKRWPGIEYHPDDIKGKGEPSYTIEKALKDHKQRKELSQDVGPGYELIENLPRLSDDSQGRSKQDYSTGINGDTSPISRLGSGIRRRVGSLRGKMQHNDNN